MQVIGWKDRLIPEITYYVSSGTLNSTHSLTHSLNYYMTAEFSATHICIYISFGSTILRSVYLNNY